MAEYNMKQTTLDRAYLLVFGHDFKIRTPAKLRELGCEWEVDTIENKNYKSIWSDKVGNKYYCTHASKSSIDFHGRDIFNDKIAYWFHYGLPMPRP